MSLFFKSQQTIFSVVKVHMHEILYLVFYTFWASLNDRKAQGIELKNFKNYI
jgi:hypothetical protein